MTGLLLERLASLDLVEWPLDAPVELDRHDAVALTRAVTNQRLTGQLAAAVDRGLVVMHPHDAAVARQMHRRAVLRTLRLEALLIRVAHALRDAAIAYRVLKGPAVVARLPQPLAALRTFVDIDLLVPQREIDAAVGLMSRLGLRREVPQLRPGFDQRFAKTVTFADPDGLQLDLHRTLAVGPFGLLIHLDDLFADAAIVDIAGHRLRTLTPELQLLNIGYHAALGDVPPRPVVLRDVALSLLYDDVEVGRVLAFAHRWKGEAVLARAVRLASSSLGLPRIHELQSWAWTFRPDRMSRRLLASYTATGLGNARKYLASLSVIPSMTDRTAYLRALLAPDADVLRRARASRRSWIVRGVRGLRPHAPGVVLADGDEA
jgi:Uncharacterised nucleotidyltransferase